MQTSSREYLDNLSQKINSMSGKQGVVRLKSAREKCYKEFTRFSDMIGVRRSCQYQAPVKWAHRHGLIVSPYMIAMKQKAEKTLSSSPEYRRGSYNEIICPNPHALSNDALYDGIYRKWTSAWQSARKCIRDIEERGFDEHGGWESRAQFDSKGRGTAISTDIYGIDEVNRLFVVQVRRYDKWTKKGYPNIRKNYFLLGYNENGNPFAHPIPSTVVHAAIRKDPSVEFPVQAAQAWIWGIKPEDLPGVLRNGDVALIPAKTRELNKATPRTEKKVRIIDSHWLFGQELRENGHLYALNPTLRHFKGQHPTQKGQGWYRVAVGNRAKFWDFARPTAD